MATSILVLADLQPPFRTIEIDLPVTTNFTTQIYLPRWCRRVIFQFETDPGKYSSEGVGGVAIDAGHMTVPADTLHSLTFDRQDRAGRASQKTGFALDLVSLLVATAAGGTTFRMTLLPSAA